MRGLTPSYSHGSKSFIDGNFNVVNRLDSFVETFENYVIDSIAEAVAQAESDLKEKAAKHPSWGGDISDGLQVTVDGGNIVYTAQDKVAGVVADIEFGNNPSPIIRPTALKHEKSMTKDLSEKISKVVPSA